MSASPFPWNVLELDPGATQKDIRRAYAVKLKQLDTAKNPEEFQELRHAYEVALFNARIFTEIESSPTEPEAVPAAGERQNEAPEAVATAEAPPAPDLTAPFETMRSLVERRDYSVAAWQHLLNDPRLDDPYANASFEYALVAALSENELKTEFTLSAKKGWQDLIESRYAWVSDGMRYTRMFPLHNDLRDALVDLGRPYRPVPYSSVPERNQFTGLGKVGLVLFVGYILIRVLNAVVDSATGP
jgi:hypothetical protein